MACWEELGDKARWKFIQSLGYLLVGVVRWSAEAYIFPSRDSFKVTGWDSSF